MWQTYPDDFELLYYCHQQDEWATETLLKKYEAFSRKIVKECIESNSMLTMFKDDFLLEAWLTLFDAINSYRERENCGFGTFYYKCATFKVKSLVRHHLRDNNIPNIRALSLDALVSDESDSHLTFQVAAMDSCSNPVYALDYKEACLKVKETLTSLKPMDRKVLGLYMNGYSYSKSSMMLGCGKKTIDNRLQKVKKLIKSSVFETEE